VTVRVRFSPAPTGYLHVGGARAALFNWLFARKTGGRFILRIEDTDADRSRPELIRSIVDALTWLGLDWDEINHQSARFEDYRRAAEDLVAAGAAYRCDCSQDEVRARAEARGGPPGYDGHCRDRRVAPGPGVVVRFRTPDTGVTGWDDVIRGRVEFDNAVLEDFVIVRSSGAPMFHLANAYDDLHMAITHVIRGEDLVNTTPRVLLLRQALGAPDHPVYAHLPLIVNEKRQKLSKRRDDVSVEVYRQRGYLPEALRNYLATLGWGPRDGVEIRPIEEIIERFDLADINKAPAFFDVKKLDHFNGEYIRALSVDEFVERSAPFAGEVDPAAYHRLAPLVQERVTRLDQIPDLLGWVTGPPPEPDERDWAKVMGDPAVPRILDLVIDRLEHCPWEPAALAEAVLGAGDEVGARSQVPVRLAVTGRRFGLPLFEPLAELDRAEVLGRLRSARARL
jgi:glutamyl-tRNA synthetase